MRKMSIYLFGVERAGEQEVTAMSWIVEIILNYTPMCILTSLLACKLN